MADLYCRTCKDNDRKLFLRGIFCLQKCSFDKGIYSDRFNEELKAWVRDRDGICQICGKTKEQNGYGLDVHHVNYVKEDSDERNLISLCHSCHKSVNFNKKQWIKYFDEKRDEDGYFPWRKE